VGNNSLNATIEKLTFEFLRAFGLITRSLAIIEKQTDDIDSLKKELKDMLEDLLKVLTSDKDGIRKTVTDISEKIENVSVLDIEKSKNKWTKNQTIMTLISNVIVAAIAAVSAIYASK